MKFKGRLARVRLERKVFITAGVSCEFTSYTVLMALHTFIEFRG